VNLEALRRSERDALVGRHREARGRYNRGMDEHAEALGMPGEIGVDEESSAFVDTPAYRDARRAYDEMVAIEEEYFRRLPRVVMGACPHCERALYRSFDPFGLDGLWWRSDAQVEEPQACPHFCVLLGAVDLGEHRPRPDFDVHPGPGAPFAMPRLLAHEGMIAVVSEIALVEGARAYPVAYFAPRRPPVQTLAAPWPRTTFVYTTQLGEHAWRRAERPRPGGGDGIWDFALDRWVASRQLRWCPPGGDRTTLAPGAGAPCPFISRPGTKEAQVILGPPG
jgi:hypothetical protein